MDINGSASSLYTQYQSLVDRYKSGDMTYQQAIKEHLELKPRIELEPQTNTYDGLNVSVQLSGNAKKINVPPEVQEALQAVLEGKSHGNISEMLRGAHVYDSANEAKQANEVKQPNVTQLGLEIKIQGPTPSIGNLTQFIGRQEIGQLRNNFNIEAFGFLSRYVGVDETKWEAAAQELGINLNSLRSGGPFWHQPEDSGIDVTMGVANSYAEKIFRHIASAADVAKFDAQMAPQQREMQIYVEKSVLKAIEKQNAIFVQFDTQSGEFAPHRATLKAAGLTVEDLRTSMMSRDESGHYTNMAQTERSVFIENTVNTNPDVRAIYDAKWESLRNKLFQRAI